jgi:hypothetical protein
MLCFYYYFFLYMYVDMINDGNTYGQINLFSPWYSWIIAEFTIKNNHPLTPMVNQLLICIMCREISFGDIS